MSIFGHVTNNVDHQYLNQFKQHTIIFNHVRIANWITFAIAAKFKPKESICPDIRGYQDHFTLSCNLTLYGISNHITSHLTFVNKPFSQLEKVLRLGIYAQVSLLTH